MGPQSLKKRSDLGNGVRRAKRNPDDQAAVERVRQLRDEYRGTALAETVVDNVREVDDLDAWARGIAESLPPLTAATEIAALGRMAAILDARVAQAAGRPHGTEAMAA